MTTPPPSSAESRTAETDELVKTLDNKVWCDIINADEAARQLSAFCKILETQRDELLNTIAAFEAGIAKEFGDGKSKRGDDLIEDFGEFCRHHSEVESERNNLRLTCDKQRKALEEIHGLIADYLKHPSTDGSPLRVKKRKLLQEALQPPSATVEEPDASKATLKAVFENTPKPKEWHMSKPSETSDLSDERKQL